MTKIAMDVEGTLADIHQIFLSYWNQKYDTNYELKDIDWHFEEVDIDIEKYLKKTKIIWKNHTKDIPPTEQGLAEKLDDMEFDIITARDEPEAIKEWLDYQNIGYDKFFVVEEKSSLEYSILVDDSPSCEHPKQIFYTQPWNEEFESYSRIENFDELKYEVEKIETRT